MWLEWSEGGGEREEGRAGVCGSQEDLGLLTPGMWEPWRAAGREGDRAWLGSPTLTSPPGGPTHLPRWSPMLALPAPQHPCLSHPTPDHSEPFMSSSPQSHRGVGGTEISCPLKSVSYVQLGPHGLWPTGLLCPWDSPGKNNGVGKPCPSPGDLPNPGIEPGHPHCGWILYHLSHQGHSSL